MAIDWLPGFFWGVAFRTVFSIEKEEGEVVVSEVASRLCTVMDTAQSSGSHVWLEAADLCISCPIGRREARGGLDE